MTKNERSEQRAKEKAARKAAKKAARAEKRAKRLEKKQAKKRDGTRATVESTPTSPATSSPTRRIRSGSSNVAINHKVKAVINNNNQTVVKTILSHPMETGLRKDRKTGKRIPADFISEIIVKHKNRDVMIAYWGPAMSKDPLLHFTFDGGVTGDEISFFWKDIKGNSGKFLTTIR